MSRPHADRRPKLALLVALPLVAGLAWLVARGPAPAGGRIRTGPTSEMRTPTDPLELSSSGAGELEDTGSESAASERAVDLRPRRQETRLRGLLVDAADGAPLPDWSLRLRELGPGGEADSFALPCTTGPDGGFSVTSWFAAGTYRVEARMLDCRGFREGPPTQWPGEPYAGTYRHAPMATEDEPRARELLTVTVEHDPERAPLLRVALEVGPRYRVQARLPEGTSACDFEAWLLREHDSFDLARPQPRNLGVLAEGEPLLARFELPVRADSTSSGRWVLRVRSADGRHAGAAFVDEVTGSVARPVALELVARAELRGRVTDAAGGPIAGASVRWSPTTAAPVRDFEPVARTDRFGKYRLDGLPCGAGRLRVEASGAAPVERELELEPHLARGDVRLDALSTGKLLGRFESSDDFVHPPRLELRPLAPGAWESPPMKLERLDARRAAFRFERVPVGSYELVVEPLDGRAWEPARLRVEVPSEGHVVRRALAASTMVVLDVLDPQTRAPLEGCFGLIGAEGELARSETNPPGCVIVDGVERFAGAALLVGAPGRRARRVELGTLRRNGRFLAGELALERGAETVALVVERDTGAPIAGARVELGTEAATSDRAGLVVLPVDAASAPLTVTRAGWRLEETRRGAFLTLVLARER